MRNLLDAAAKALFVASFALSIVCEVYANEGDVRLLDIQALRRLDFSDETKLKFTIPQALAAAYPNGVDHRESYFGTPNYGSHLGRVFYATPNATDTVSDAASCV